MTPCWASWSFVHILWDGKLCGNSIAPGQINNSQSTNIDGRPVLPCPRGPSYPPTYLHCWCRWVQRCIASVTFPKLNYYSIGTGHSSLPTVNNIRCPKCTCCWYTTIPSRRQSPPHSSSANGRMNSQWLAAHGLQKCSIVINFRLSETPFYSATVNLARSSDTRYPFGRDIIGPGMSVASLRCSNYGPPEPIIDDGHKNKFSRFRLLHPATKCPSCLVGCWVVGGLVGSSFSSSTTLYLMRSACAHIRLQFNKVLNLIHTTPDRNK